ncbi:DUF1351 domain-containing protein [uncultured Ruminococcus sp.]|uniref:DUF1351 domain-containing protein n=1 Tax=uncultured Ruminococcus sp. TaxID=165186 RepID=UPI00265D0233|nr:DUF1351 domain-containing protein [uncultured Ruminococcus sp.]
MTKIIGPVNLLETTEVEETAVQSSKVTELNPEQLIVVKQVPVIIEKLESVKPAIEEKVEAACAMVCTENNYKEIKKLRASLNKEFTEFEKLRKAVKSEVMLPYERFESVYKECISNPYKKSDAALKSKNEAVEHVLKKEKSDEAEKYFDEYSQLLGIDFVKLEQVGLNITMTVTIKKLRETIKAFLDKVMDDLKLIATQEYKDEILYEYKRNLNVSAAITTVNERFRAIEEEKARAEAERAEREKAEQAVNNTVAEYEPFVANVAEEVAPPADEDEKILSLSFKVYGTNSQLKEFARYIKNYLSERGMRYE